MCVCGSNMAQRMGIYEQHLVSLALRVAVADNKGLKLVGAGFVTSMRAGRATTSQIVYFADGVEELFLSKTMCTELGIIGPDFPTVHPSTLTTTGRRRRLSSATFP